MKAMNFIKEIPTQAFSCQYCEKKFLKLSAVIAWVMSKCLCLLLPLLFCESWMFVKESPDRKKIKKKEKNTFFYTTPPLAASALNFTLYFQVVDSDYTISNRELLFTSRYYISLMDVAQNLIFITWYYIYFKLLMILFLF